jgi:hypothetical protein
VSSTLRDGLLRDGRSWNPLRVDTLLETPRCPVSRCVEKQVADQASSNPTDPHSRSAPQIQSVIEVWTLKVGSDASGLTEEWTFQPGA